MSESIHIRDGLAVTRYVGPGDTPGIDRIRLRIDDRTGSVYGMTANEAMLTACALVELTAQAAMRAANGRLNAGT